MYQVKQKDGSLKRFDRFKIISGAMRSGATSDEAENTAQKVETWMMFSAPKGPVDSKEVRKQTIKALSGENPTAARTYGVLEK